MRLVDVGDADFIAKIRSDVMLSRYIHGSDGAIGEQRSWICQYKQRESEGQEYYFVFESPEGKRYGTTRISEIKENSYVGGSWVFCRETPGMLPLLGLLATRDYAFFLLGFDCTYFNVDKQNRKVLRFQELFKPTIIGQNDREYQFSLTREQYANRRDYVLSLIK